MRSRNAPRLNALTSAGRRRGFTYMEVLVASLIGSVVVGGTMMAYVTAARIANRQNSPNSAEANTYAQQTIENLRNRVAADIVSLGTPIGTWQADPLPPPGGGFFLGNGPQSITSGPGGATRVLCVFRADCTGDGDTLDVDDCFAAQVKVCWNGTMCPAVGSACP